MIKHVVSYKIKEDKLEKLTEAKLLLLSLKEHVKEVREIEVGVDILHSDRSYDLILQVTFDSVEDMNDYQKNIYHVNVVKPFMHDIRSSSVAVDYEVAE